MNFLPVLGKRILITGDVNAGKTTAARTILRGLCNLGLAPRIAVVDMAPEIPEEIAARRGLTGVGGKLLPGEWRQVLYLATPLRPPRLSSKSEEEAVAVAADNRDRVEVLFEDFRSSGRDILFLNDASMYLQAGNTEDLLAFLSGANTVVVNGYCGGKLGTGALSARERTEMDKLIAAFPYHVRMPEESLEHLLKTLRG